MANSHVSEANIYARHERVKGTVLIIGVGAVGGFIAEELASMGISPLYLVDYDILADENLIRHTLGASCLGRNKASSLAAKIHEERPWCDALGVDVSFLEIPTDLQVQLVHQADVVVVAAEDEACRLRVNELCIEAQVPAVYPAVWVSDDLGHAEVGEIYWMDPERNTPCYLCWLETQRTNALGEGGTGHGMSVDIRVFALAATSIIRALVGSAPTHLQVLDPERTLILVHSFTPTSEPVQRLFHGPRFDRLSESGKSGLRSRNVAVRFRPEPCTACGGHLPFPIPSADGLASLRALGEVIARRENERAIEEARIEAERVAEENRRTVLWELALEQFREISDTLKDVVFSAAQVAEFITDPQPLRAARYDWAIELDHAGLMMMSPSRAIAVPDAPFDIIGAAALVVANQGGHAQTHYVGRGHSLWFCDAQAAGEYRWYETSFLSREGSYDWPVYDWPVKERYATHLGLYSPVSLSPDLPAVIEAFGSSSSDIRVAWPFTQIVVSDMQDFIDRWAGWLATAAREGLSRPQQIPEHNPAGTWRTDGT